MPAPQDTYKDPVLSDISVRYANSHFIADSVFPTLQVEKETGYYFVFDKENTRVPVTTKRSDFARATRVDYGLTATPYGPLTERSLEVGIPDRVMKMYQAPLQPETNATNTATEKLLLEKEVGLATDLGAAAGLVTQNVTKSGTGQWSDYVNSTPFSDIRIGISTIKKGAFIAPNVAVMGQQVLDILVNHPNFVDRIKYTQTADQGTLLGALAGLLGVSKVYVGDAVQNSAAEGIADSMNFVWGKHFWLMYVAEAPAIEVVSAGYHLTLSGGRFVDKWYEQQIKTQFVRANDYYDRKIVAAEAIYAIYNAVA
jgi:hypothetical protein